MMNNIGLVQALLLMGIPTGLAFLVVRALWRIGSKPNNKD